MKFHVYCDDRYPVYGLANSPSNWANAVEISDELYAEIIAVENAYAAMQERLAALAGQQHRTSSLSCRDTTSEVERITQADIDAIQRMAVESDESIQAALEAFNARMSRVA